MKIETEKQLRELYGYPGGRAERKVLTSLDIHATRFIQKSPFAVISTFSKNGQMDASPRGGKPGFVKVLDDGKIIIPDAKGNNRMDSISNIMHTERIGSLFLIPGVDETLRINGSAFLSTDEEILQHFTEEQHLPKAGIVVQIEEVFLHCAKALMRSKLWQSEAQIKRTDFPTMGQMLKDQLGVVGEIETQEEMIKRYSKDL